ncbi:trypsin-like serine protease [Flagellimonas sediminis]|uniref:Trypsin-like serine protease n=1 Tax=Flagellimonas sediminis TaxID=2696468 RepID=A0A6I5L236_9FLAO|nr:trypsin-like serine protease [Allomuricauda sediminis]NDV43791.1 trypsin-like serine protease [Allomuricauda sediminis]
MKTRLLSSLFIIFWFVSYGQVNIIGGNDTTIENHPWQISIRDANTNAHFCGGSILTPEWILTAAHCVDGQNPADIEIAAGITMRLDNVNGQYRNVAQIIVHPNFDSSTLNNDVALIRLTAPLNFNATVQPIQLTNSAGHSNAGLIGTLSGWGYTTNNGPVADQLQAVTMPIITNSQANGINTGSNNVNNNMIAFYQAGSSAAPGDSGGPATVLSNGSRFLIGCSSWGETPKDQKPTIYTKLFNYRSWIQGYVPIPSINGPECACSTPNSTITLNNTNATTVNWNHSSNIISVSQNNSQFVFKALSGTRGNGWVTATFNGNVYRHDLWIGAPNAPSTLSGPSVVLTGAIVKYNSSIAPGASSYEWRLPYPFDVVNQIDYFAQNWQMTPTTGRYLSAFTGYAGTSGLVQVWGKNICGNGGAKTMSVSHGSGGGGGIPLQANLIDENLLGIGTRGYPNPVDKDLYIHIQNRESAPMVSVYLNSIDGRLVYYSDYKSISSIGVSTLPEGQYILTIDTGLERKSTNIIIKHH